MNPYRDTFSIRDLEEFSGVKAHTIRIWEKRYGLLAPDRTGTNIRKYGLDELKVILNVALLNQQGIKISRIAAMTPSERDRMVQESTTGSGALQDTVNGLKLAMLTFDEKRFRSLAASHQGAHGFRSLVEEVYVPLLAQIGLLWQANSICPAQEHFVSNLIRQHVIVETHAQPFHEGKKDRTFVLYLPENEIHELGLLYVDYVLRSRGEATIYLGQSVPMNDLSKLAAVRHGELTMVSILTTDPPSDEVPAYLKGLRNGLPDRRISFLLTGGQLGRSSTKTLPYGVKTCASMRELLLEIERITA